MEEISYEMLNSANQLDDYPGEEFEATTEALAQFDRERREILVEEQELESQRNAQQQEMASLKHRLEVTKHQLAAVRANYGRQQLRLLQIATYQREIPKLESRIEDLKIHLENCKQATSVKIQERTVEMNKKVEEKKKSYEEILEQKERQLERDLKALKQILAQEDEPSIFLELQKQHQEELERMRIDLDRQLEHEKANAHNKCRSNVEELTNKIQALRRRIQQNGV